VDDELPADTVLAGAALATNVDLALARLALEAAATKQAGTAAAADPEESEGRRGRKKRRRKAETKPKTKETWESWSILVQPVFSKNTGGDTDDLLFRRDHIVVLPARENAAHLEWWHFQHHSIARSGSWGALVEECGYSKEVLRIPEDGSILPQGEPVHVGLGYTSGPDGQIESTPWPGKSEREKRPANFDLPADEAVEDYSGDIE
jgi:hypothetical protein